MSLHRPLTFWLVVGIGCFENYLLARDTDNEAFPRISEALDWLYFFDRLDGKLRSDRDYELLGYVPYSFVPWYPLFSSQTPNPVELPKTDYEVRRLSVARRASPSSTDSMEVWCTDVSSTYRTRRNRNVFLAQSPAFSQIHVYLDDCRFRALTSLQPNRHSRFETDQLASSQERRETEVDENCQHDDFDENCFRDRQERRGTAKLQIGSVSFTTLSIGQCRESKSN